MWKRFRRWLAGEAKPIVFRADGGVALCTAPGAFAITVCVDGQIVKLEATTLRDVLLLKQAHADADLAMRLTE